MQLSIIAQLLLRLKSKSPKLFVAIQWIAGIAACIVWALNGAIAHQIIKVPGSPIWVNYLNTIAGIFMGIFTGAALTSKDPQLMDPDAKAAVIDEATNNSKGTD